jgi:prolyl-tRNA editing enzyme YbaK/EbsC (Cys-tRNA(Pro) deacylase)
MARGNVRFVEHARTQGLEIEVTVFPDGTRTAADAAAAIGCTVGQIAKSLVLMADGRAVVAITAGDNRVDIGRVAAVLGAADVRLARPDETREATGYAIGGVPPFGHASPLVCLLDRDLLRFETVWAAAGTPDATFPIEPARLAEVSGATVADFRAE